MPETIDMVEGDSEHEDELASDSELAVRKSESCNQSIGLKKRLWRLSPFSAMYLYVLATNSWLPELHVCKQVWCGDCRLALICLFFVLN